MTRLFIQSEEVELERNIKFSYLKENSLFMFEKLKLNRTQAFKVKRTPRNDKIFEFSHIPETGGTFTRFIKDATVYYSGGNIVGELFINNFEDGNYNCVFVYGNLQKLKEIKEAGNLENFLEVDDEVGWNSTTTPANYHGNIYQIVKYENGMSAFIPNRWNYYPVVKFLHLYSKARAHFGMTQSFSTDDYNFLNNCSIKVNSIKDIVEAGEEYNIDMNGAAGTITISGGTALSVVSRQFRQQNGTIITCLGFRASRQLRCVFLGYFPVQVSFLAFNQNRQYYGRNPYYYGQYFLTDAQMNEGDEIYFQLWNDHAVNTQGMNAPDEFVTLRPVAFTISGQYRLAAGWKEIGQMGYSNWRMMKLKDNLPEVSFIDLIMTAKELLGAGVIINGNAIEFYYFTFNEEPPIILDSTLIKEKSIRRTILDFARNNIVEFDSADYVKNRLRNVFEIVNETIEEESDLFTIPFSETDVNAAGAAVVLDTEYDGTNFKLIGEGSELMWSTYQEVGMRQIRFRFHPNLKNIFNKGTMKVATFFMYEFQFNAINEKSWFIFKNKKWAWATAKWTNNVAELTLILLD